MDVSFKILVESYSSMQVVFFRCFLSMPLFLVWILLTGPRQLKTAHPFGQAVRALFGLGMLYATGECFREMQLADAYALFFAAPLLITLLSGPVLGEPAGLARIVASVVGFSGVLVMLNPSTGGWMGYGATMGMIAVLLYAVSSLLLRRLGREDSTITITFWFVLLVGMGAGLLSMGGWKPVNYDDWPLLLILAITGTGGQILITAAFRRASAAVVAPFDYTHMLWAVIFGYFLWGYLPGVQVWVGSAILVLSGLFILYRERRVASRQAKALSGNKCK
jgi:drug/metabolite transporter (DMT)-like permease